MNWFLRKLRAAFRQVGGRRAGPRPRGVRLELEAMETRLVPSAAAPMAAVPASTPALTAPVAVLTDGTGGLPVATPDAGPVHGYKWRRRKPWSPYDITSGGSTGQQLGGSVVAEVFQAQPAQANHLVLGGSDGPALLSVVDGHLVTHPPEGPLPTELSSGIL
jgi:hypothetical protein